MLRLVEVSAIILGHLLFEAQARAKVGDFKWQWQWFVLFFQGWTVQPLDDLESSGSCFSRRCVPWPIGGGDICQFWFLVRSPKRLPWWTWWPAVLWTLATTKGRVEQSPQQRWRWGLELSWSSGWRFLRAQRCKIGQKLLMTHNVTSTISSHDTQCYYVTPGVSKSSKNGFFIKLIFEVWIFYKYAKLSVL